MLHEHLHVRVELVGDQRPVRALDVALAVGRRLEELAVARQVPGGRRDVRVRLDHVAAQRLVAARDPAVGGRAGEEHVVAAGDRERAEDRLDHAPPGLDVDALVADRVAVEGRRLPGDDVGDPDVRVPQHEPPARHGVGGLPLLAGEEAVQVEVSRQQRLVHRRGEVAGRPRGGVDDRRGDREVVEDRGVRAEALLAHHLLGVQGAGVVPVLGVALRGHVPDPSVVHGLLLVTSAAADASGR